MYGSARAKLDHNKEDLTGVLPRVLVLTVYLFKFQKRSNRGAPLLGLAKYVH